MALFDTGFNSDYPEIIKNKPDFVASYPEQTLFNWGLSALTTSITAPYNKVREIAQSIIKDLLFPASSVDFQNKLDPVRLESSREKLRLLGGLNYIIETPDGIQIDAMFISAKKFRENIVQNGGQFKTKIDKDGKTVSLIKIYNPIMHALLKDMKVDFAYVNFNNAFIGKAISKIIMYQLDEAPNTSKSIIDEEPGISIIGEGNAGLYEFNRHVMFKLLMNGSDVIAPNIRGTGESTGNPNENGTYLDYESVYQFVSNKLNYPNNKITAHSYCLSSGPLTKLASKHPIHLDIDRGYNKLGDAMGPSFLKLIGFKLDDSLKSKIINKIAPTIISTFSNYFIISYNNGSNLSGVKGSIFLLDATDDKIIPKTSSSKLRESLDRTNVLSAQVSFVGGHTDFWDETTTILYQEFSAQRGTLFNYGNSPKPTVKQRHEYQNLLEKIVSTSYDTGKFVAVSGNQNKCF